jgi:hypothetical protein|tara:strand:+ start:44 stop:580 length:537 start_codon:yes stop_codon:yes gene_type:complete
MAAGNTTDTRTHVMGDMLMVTGTFTDGGIDVSYDSLLATVFAAGGHVTSLYDTGIKINDGDDMAVGDTAMVVDTVDVRLHFNVGETIYNSAGARVGVITAIASATALTIGAGVLVAIANNDNLFKLGPDQSAVTLNDGSLAVSIDETNKRVVFGNGNLGATSTAHTQDGRWWILGRRS